MSSSESAEGQVAEHTDLTKSSSSEDLPRKFTFEELEIATDHFSDDQSFEVGDFGVGYKGDLPSGDVAMVMRFKSRQHGNQEEELENQTKEELENQMKDVGSLSHPNLVKLVGYCCEEDRRLFVLEFVPYNSLRSHLSGES